MSSNQSGEGEIRKALIEADLVDCMVALPGQLFYSTQIPVCLWFISRDKSGGKPSTRPLGHPSPTGRRDGDEGKQNRADTVLFIDARHIYRQVDRAHREWTPAQTSFLANLVRLYRGEVLDFTLGGDEARAKVEEIFGLPSTSGRRAGDEGDCKVAYRDVAGLCRAATLKEIEAQGWSLNPGRYVGVAAGEAVSDEDFKEQLETLNEELETLNAQARDLEQTIAGNVAEILEAV
jgi:type I restriction enzyme M protein